MDIHTSRVWREAEQRAFEEGLCTAEGLMEDAIRSAVIQLRQDAQFADMVGTYPRVIVYAGKGLNAGDALGIARELGYTAISLRCVTDVSEMAELTRYQLKLTSARAAVTLLGESPKRTCEGTLIIDGLLGSGARNNLSPRYAELTAEINHLRAHSVHCCVLAVDSPIGLHVDEGTAAPYAVRADATLAIGCVKAGLLVDGAENYVGRIICVPLAPALLQTEKGKVSVADGEILTLLPHRDYSCYKHRAGRVRIVAGSIGMLGAAQMCAQAALRAGAGLVELFCLPDVYELLAVRAAPEVMVRRVNSFTELPSEGAQAWLVGPGMGTPDVADRRALSALLAAAECPVVLDADALRLLAAGELPLPKRAILTPHAGEMRCLFPESENLSRVEAASSFVQQNPCTLLLKGARSLSTDGSQIIYNSTGGPYMANGGQGDVLAGVVAALAAQGLAPLHAAALAAYLCGRAACAVYAKQHFPPCVCATDILPFLCCSYL